MNYAEECGVKNREECPECSNYTICEEEENDCSGCDCDECGKFGY